MNSSQTLAKSLSDKLPPQTTLTRTDLADHFVSCSKLGRFLTMQDSGRFVITDDFSATSLPRIMTPIAASIAAITSKDDLVARAAILPLGVRALKGSTARRDKYEELFELIERQALNPIIKQTARDLLNSGFREARIDELEAELGGFISPARKRYRAFLEVVSELMSNRISVGAFIDEFVGFTRAVAGRLDFGIYSFCLDRIFMSTRVPLKVKKMIVMELMNYPPMVRRELLSNLLANPLNERELSNFTRHTIAMHLEKPQAVEIELLEAVKSKRVSMEEIEQNLAAAG